MVKELNENLSSGDENNKTSRQRKTKISTKLKRIKKPKSKAVETEKPATDLESCLQVIKINNQLEQVAAKNNLTDANVRKILKRVVTNEHVLAIVKLKESEEVDEKVTSEGVDEKVNLLNITPLTRSKVKELQQKDLPVVWPIPVVSPVQPTASEVAVLINQELPDDSSDEEYNPDDENISDDEKIPVKKNIEIKNVNDVPKPQDNNIKKISENISDLTEFKTPQTNLNEDETIALRTRSKLCLSSTNIETIEKAFIPPDITSDMYDCDDIDGVWKDFLNKFTEPLPQHQEDDEETDPEYNVQVDEIPVDKEELREDQEVTVTRRELSDLVAELLDMDSLPDMDVLCNTNEEPVQFECEYIPVNNDAQPANELANNEITSNREPKCRTKSITVEVIDDFTSDSQDSIMTSSQKLILAQQLRQHVQLCTQHFLQLYGHPELWALAESCKQNLLHILSLSGNNRQTAFHAHNLKDAIELCENWEKRLSVDNEETRSIYKFIQTEINRSRANKLSHNRYYSQFPPQLMDVVCDSKVFIYPDLLPRIPFRLDLSNGGVKELTESEQHVIAIELYLFYKYMENNPHLYKQGNKRLYTLSNAAQLIEKYLKNGRSAQTIARQIRKKILKNAKDNPIKYYFKYRKPPPTEHVLLPFDPDFIITPRKQPVHKLHYIWKTHVMKPPVEFKREDKICFIPKHTSIAINENESCTNADNNFKIEINQSLIENILIPNTIQNTPFASEKNQLNINTENLSDISIACNETVAHNNCSLPILITSPDLNNTSLQISKPPLLNYVSTPLSSVFLTSVSNNASNKLCIQITDQISPILKNDVSEAASNEETINKVVCDCESKLLNNKSMSGQRLLTDYFISYKSKTEYKSLNSIRRKEMQVINKLKLYMQTYFKCALNNLFLIYNVNKTEKCIRKAFIHILTLDYFFSIYFPKLLPLMSNFMLLQENNNKSASFTSSEDNINDLMSDDSETTHLQEKNIDVNIYYASVRRCLDARKTDINEFHEIIIGITAENKPSEIYEKLEKLFLPHNPNLLKQFVLLLLPQKSEKILKFVEIILNSNIDLFIQMVNSHLSDSEQIKKIYIALSDLSDIPDISMCDVISSVLPLLKGNTILRKWFLQLFPCEMLSESDIIDHRYMDSMKIISNNKMNSNNSLEEISYGRKNCKCQCHVSEMDKYINNFHCTPCGMKYIQEKVLNQQNMNKQLPELSLSTLEKNKDTSIDKKSIKEHSNNNKIPLSITSENNENKENLTSDSLANENSISRIPNKKLKLDKNSERIGSFQNLGSSKNIQVNICDSTETNFSSCGVNKNSENNDTVHLNNLACDQVSSSDGYINSDSDFSLTCDKDVGEGSSFKNALSEENNSLSQKSHKITSDYKNESTSKEKDKKIKSDKNCDISKTQEVHDSKDWTRDEDKIILHLLQTNVILKLNKIEMEELLPNKSLLDIKKRSQLLLKVLQKCYKDK